MSDVAILFARDPLSLTKDNIDKMIQHIRDNREVFDRGKPAKRGFSPKKKPAAGRLPKALQKIDNVEELVVDIEDIL